MSKGVDVALTVAMIVAGEAAVLVSRVTAPEGTVGDMWDSDLFLPTLLLVGLVCLLAATVSPRRWGVFAVAALVPYYATQIWLGLFVANDPLWVLGLAMLVPLSLVPVVGGSVGATIGVLVRIRYQT